MKPGSLSAEQRELLDRLLDGNAPERRPIRRGSGVRSRAPLSSWQERLHFVDQLEPGSPRYTVSGALRLRAEVDVPLLRRAVRTLVDRHAAPRTRFEAAGVVEQVVLPPGSVTVDVPVAEVAEVAEADIAPAVRQVAATGFDLGGHSLLAARTIARIKTTLGADLRIERFFCSPTVAATAEMIDTAGVSDVTSLPSIRRVDREAHRIS